MTRAAPGTDGASYSFRLAVLPTRGAACGGSVGTGARSPFQHLRGSRLLHRFRPAIYSNQWSQVQVRFTHLTGCNAR